MTDTVTPRPLTTAHVEVIAGFARGLSVSQIATELGVEETAVQRRTTVAAKAIGVTGARQAALVHHAYAHGYLPIGERRHFTSLPPRLAQILDCATRGLGYRATANELGITARTAKCHRDRLHKAFGVHTTAQAVAHAWASGLLPTSSPSQPVSDEGSRT